MSGNDVIIEYKILRDEINQKIELVNSLTTFTLTTIVAILTFALTKKNPLLYLLPFCIVIPMYMRISYYRSAMVKISAYMIVFLEEHNESINWETRNMYLMDNIKRKDKSIVLRARYYENFVLGIICYILYVNSYIKEKEMSFLLIIHILTPFLFVVWMWFTVRHINDIEGEKKEWIKEWEKVKRHLKE